MSRAGGGTVTRMFGHYLSPEMVVLWLLEFAIFAVGAQALLLAGEFGPAGVGQAGVGPGAGILGQAAILAMTAGLISVAIGLYRPEICLDARRLLINTSVAGVLTLPAVLAIGLMTGIDTGLLRGPSLFRPVGFVLGWIAILFASRVAFSLAMRLNVFARRVLIIGTAAEAAPTETAIRSLRRGFFTVAGVLPPGAGPRLAPAVLLRQRIWGVVVTAGARGLVPQDELLRCRHAGIGMFGDVEFREQQLRRIDLERLEADWMLFAPGLARGRAEQAVRRGFDVVISLLFLIATLPVMLLTAAAIRLDSPGPALYRQERVGLHGRVFTLLKFRSMRIDAEQRGPIWASQKDPRVTRIGAFLRRVRIDELPQLFNVLQGSMCFVGPRPERPHFVEQLAEVIRFYQDRASVKPGITGWAQVNFPYGASIEDARQKLSYDLYYVRHRSLFLDLLILFATVRVILFQEGSR